MHGDRKKSSSTKRKQLFHQQRIRRNHLERRVFIDKILRINMGAAGGPKATVTPVGAYAGLGGRAMTPGIVSKESRIRRKDRRNVHRACR